MSAQAISDSTKPLSLSESPSRTPITPAIPSVGTRGPTLGRRRLRWLRCMISRAVSTVSSIWSVLVEEALQETGGRDEVSATSEGRVEAGDEEVKMGTEDTGAF